jgi:hypothetical protein
MPKNSTAILAGKDVLAHEIPQILRPSQQPLLDRLRRLHRATIDLSEIAQEVISHTNAATGLQQHLVEAAFESQFLVTGVNVSWRRSQS